MPDHSHPGHLKTKCGTRSALSCTHWHLWAGLCLRFSAGRSSSRQTASQPPQRKGHSLRASGSSTAPLGRATGGGESAKAPKIGAKNKHKLFVHYLFDSGMRLFYLQLRSLCLQLSFVLTVGGTVGKNDQTQSPDGGNHKSKKTYVQKTKPIHHKQRRATVSREGLPLVEHPQRSETSRRGEIPGTFQVPSHKTQEKNLSREGTNFSAPAPLRERPPPHRHSLGPISLIFVLLGNVWWGHIRGAQTCHFVDFCGSTDECRA